MHSLDAGTLVTKHWIERFAQSRDSHIQASLFYCRMPPQGIHQAALGDQISFVLRQNEQSAKGCFVMEIEGLTIKK